MPLSEFHATYFTVRAIDEIAVAKFQVPHLSEDQNVELLGHDLFSLVDHYHYRKVILRMNGVTYLTSSVLGKFITLHRRLHRLDGRMMICDLETETREILESSRLIQYFHVADNMDQAVALLRQPEA